MPQPNTTRFAMVPARRSDQPTAARRARRTLMVLALCAALGVVSFLVTLGRANKPVDLSGVQPHGRDLAYVAAQEFIDGRPLDVPHAASFKPQDASLSGPGDSVPFPTESMTWTGFTREDFGSKATGVTSFEIHHFMVQPKAPATQPSTPATTPSSAVTGTQPPSPVKAPPALGPAAPASSSPTAASTTTGPSSAQADATVPGALMLDVPVLLTADGPRLAAAPSFSLWSQASASASGAGDYTNYTSQTAQAPQPVVDQIGRWATAFAGSDSEALRALTGDQDPGHRYEGLTGFAVRPGGSRVQILSAINADHGRMIVRVRVALVYAPAAPTVPSGAGAPAAFETYADYDLLIGSPSGAQPPVLAWGPSGSAADLEPYSNALPA